MAKTAVISFTEWATQNPYFEYFGAGRRVVDGVMEIDALSSYPGFSTTGAWDLSGSHFGIQLIQPPNTDNGSPAFQMQLRISDNDYLLIGGNAQTLFAGYRIDGVDDQVYFGYNATQHKYLRIREAGGQTYWESSPDGVVWTNLRPPTANPVNVLNLYVLFLAGNWNNAVNPGMVRIGRVNRYEPTNSNGVVDFGVANEQWPPTNEIHQTNTTEAGRKPKYDLFFTNWDRVYDNLTVANLNTVSALGMTPYVTWEAWDTTMGATYNYASILAGTHNAYIDHVIDTVKTFGKTIYIRPFHEMNGGWYPWGIGVNGNTAAQHVQAWIFIRNRFIAAGATNAKFVWSPNIILSGGPDLATLYPGNDNVDVVAVDGYNWGTINEVGVEQIWKSPAQIFDPTMSVLRHIGVNKPLWLGEVASRETEEGKGTKADWLDRFFRWMRAQPDIRAFVWFNIYKSPEPDWRISSSPEASAAFRAGMSTISASTTDVPPVATGNVQLLSDGRWLFLSQPKQLF